MKKLTAFFKPDADTGVSETSLTDPLQTSDSDGNAELVSIVNGSSNESFAVETEQKVSVKFESTSVLV